MRTLQIGERVRVHPASDWFMRGIVYAVVTSKRTINGQTVYYLRNDTAAIAAPRALRLKLTREYLLATEDK